MLYLSVSVSVSHPFARERDGAEVISQNFNFNNSLEDEQLHDDHCDQMRVRVQLCTSLSGPSHLAASSDTHVRCRCLCPAHEQSTTGVKFLFSEFMKK